MNGLTVKLKRGTFQDGINPVVTCRKRDPVTAIFGVSREGTCNGVSMVN